MKKIISIVMIIITLLSIGTISTSAASPATWKMNNVSDVSSNDAKISSKISFSKKVTFTEGGFYIGTSNNNLKKNPSPDKINIKSSYLNSSFLMSKYNEKLKPNTTYYYKIYVIANKKTYTSPVKSFKTSSTSANSTNQSTTFTDTPTKICFPLSTKQIWYASTYEGHGGKNKSAYSSVDITLKNKKNCKGYAVYAVEDGVVHVDDYKKSNGQITIKHTKKLVTTNGAVYTTWYSTYAHMTNISVKEGDVIKKGQQIGKVGNVGNSKGAHLHFSISSGNNNTKWYQETNINKAISPYYVYGFVTQNNNNTSYLIRDMKGPGVTKQLINHKPSGK
ncbi:MAG: M23 family metallopeptidase [Clostridia bacterium]|nr:M23 family metallopeptidase [Clostridia bacterium]